MSARDVYLSLFMFTTNLQPGNPDYTKVIIQHMSELRKLGYSGFDLPIFPNDGGATHSDVESYLGLRRSFDRAGLDDLGFTTNVAATRSFDPTSPYREQREAALAYLKSRVDITAALGATIMAGPIVFLASDAAAYVNGHTLHVDGGVAEVLSLPVAVSS